MCVQEVDVCGCDGVSEEVVSGAVQALLQRPRPLTLRLAGTAASPVEVTTYTFITIILLTINVFGYRLSASKIIDISSNINIRICPSVVIYEYEIIFSCSKTTRRTNY